LDAGDMDLNDYLGYDYFLTGNIIQRQTIRTFGMIYTIKRGSVLTSLRSEQKFDSVSASKAQLKKDKKQH
jgi:FAD synthase